MFPVVIFINYYIQYDGTHALAVKYIISCLLGNDEKKSYICTNKLIMKKTMIMRIAIMLCMVATMVACNEKENYPYHTDYLPVQLTGSQKWSILDVNSGELVAKDAFTMAPSPVIGDMFYVMNEDGTYNFYNIANPTTAVNKEPYGSVTVFSEDGLAVASKRGGSLCVINKQCEVVKELPKDISQCSMFSRGMASYQNDLGLWGYIDVKGDTVIPAKYASVNLFVNDDYAIVVDAEQVNDTVATYSVINKKGEVMFNASSSQYGVIQPYYVNGVLPVVKGDTIVCLNSKGEEVANPNDKFEAVENAGYDDYTRTPNGKFIVINKDGKMGLVDKNNNTLIDIKHERLMDLRDDRYIVGQDTVFSLVDVKGAPVGKVKFAHAHGGTESVFATRGFIDINLAVGSMMMMFDTYSCAGATSTSTLMDMNGLLSSNPESSVGQNGIAIPQGPFIVRYMFDRPIASKEDANAPASYNLDARIVCVDISLNVLHCGLDTEAAIIGQLQANMGTKGFVLDSNNMFENEQGQVISVGYNSGIVSLVFFMNKAIAQPMPRNPRK